VAQGRQTGGSATIRIKLLYLAIRNIEKKWTMAPHFWDRAVHQFNIMLEGRLPA